jgi:hypothetical protein
MLYSLHWVVISFDNGRNAGGFVIGTGVDATSPLQACDEPNSLSVGFNSDIPTLFVGASAGRKHHRKCRYW